MSLELLTALQEAVEAARIDRDRLALEVEEAQSLAMANAERFATAQGQFVERTHEVRAYEKLIETLRPRRVRA